MLPAGLIRGEGCHDQACFVVGCEDWQCYVVVLQGTA